MNIEGGSAGQPDNRNVTNKRWKNVRRPAHSERRSYQNLRSEIQTGDLLLFRGNRFLSGVIERLSDSPYSHIAILARWHGRVLAFHSDGRGVEILPASKIVCRYRGKVDLWTLKPEWRGGEGISERLLLDNALTLLGIKFGYWRLVKLAFRILLGRAFIPKDAHATPDSLFCSQFVSLCYRQASNNRFDVNPVRNDASTSPGDFANPTFFEQRCQLYDGSNGAACQDLFAFTRPVNAPRSKRRPAVRTWTGEVRLDPGGETTHAPAAPPAPRPPDTNLEP